MVRWRQSIYAVEPHMMYGLSVIRPISCQPVNDRIVVKICYPVVKKSNMYSLFEVKHRGAFNADSTVFGYANIADHIAVPLHDESGRNVDSVENVDLARCELKFGSVWTCRGLVSDHYKYCGLDGIVNCTWQLMPVKDHGFVYTRVIGDRYLIATTVQDYFRISANRTVTEDGQKEKVPSNIFELKLSNEVAIIGSEHLSPISTVTNVKSDFLTPTLSVLYEHFFDDDDKADVQKMVALTHDASEAGRKFNRAWLEAEDVDFFRYMKYMLRHPSKFVEISSMRAELRHQRNDEKANQKFQRQRLIGGGVRPKPIKEKVQARRGRKKAGQVTVIRVEDLSLTPPELICSTPIPAGTSGVTSDSTSNQNPPSKEDQVVKEKNESTDFAAPTIQSKARRRKDVHPPQDEDSPQKQLIPSTTEPSQNQVQERQSWQAETSSRKRRQQEQHASQERERIAKLSPNSAEARRRRRAESEGERVATLSLNGAEDRRGRRAGSKRERVATLSPNSAEARRLQRAEKEKERLAKLTPAAAEQLRRLRVDLRQIRLQQSVPKKRKLATDRAAQKRLSATRSPLSKKAYLLNRRFKYSKRYQSGAPIDWNQVVRVQAIHQVAANVRANANDQRRVPATAAYRRMLDRQQRNRRFFNLAEQYLALTSGGRHQRFSSIRKSRAQQKVAKLHSTAEEMSRIVKSDMHQMFRRFHKNYLKPASESIKDAVDEADIERKLVQSYGGSLQFHTKTHELFGLDLDQFTYQPIATIIDECQAGQNENDDQEQDVVDSDEALAELDQLGEESIRCLLAELEAVSQEHAVVEQPLDATLQENASKSEAVYVVEEQAVYRAEEEATVDAPEGNASVQTQGMARHCSPDCAFPTNWATRLHSALLKLNSNGTAEDLCNAIAQFEDCTECQPHLRCIISDLDTCTNGLRLLIAAMVHFQHLRTVIRRYYEIRQSFIWLRDMKDALENSDLERLMALIKNPNLNAKLRERIDESVRREEGSAHSQEALFCNRHFRSIIREFEKGIRNFRVDPCQVCDRLFQESELKEVPLTDFLHTLGSADFSTDTVMICSSCKTYAVPSHGKPPSIPPMAAVNDMGVDEVPPELQGLNWVETMLIQRAKPFQTMVQLKPYGNHHLDLVRASRGLALHLPLPLQGTIDHTLQTLPSTKGLRIWVDSLATKEKKIHRTLVNVRKVIEALKWLQKNNPFYKDITIDLNPAFDDIIELVGGSNASPASTMTSLDESDRLAPKSPSQSVSRNSAKTHRLRLNYFWRFLWKDGNLKLRSRRIRHLRDEYHQEYAVMVTAKQEAALRAEGIDHGRLTSGTHAPLLHLSFSNLVVFILFRLADKSAAVLRLWFYHLAGLPNEGDEGDDLLPRSSLFKRIKA
uniref:DUF6570 domain-containing protein n=1 Tax=Plectus sambesii TaxID=2011161 RepID=A0A914X0K6_9BILA